MDIKIETFNRIQTLLDTGMFAPLEGNLSLLKLKGYTFIFDAIGLKWLRGSGKFKRYLSTDEIFELVDDETKAALIWHLDILS